jgi:hypothetical protein
MAGGFSFVGKSSAWTGGRVGSTVGRTGSVGWGVAGAAQALMSKIKALNRINLDIIVFSCS